MDSFGGIKADREKDPEKWNKEWEAYLGKKFKPLPSYPDLSFLSEFSPRILGQGMLASMEEQRKELCTLQKDLAGLVADKREGGHLDSKWLSMSPETRAEYILKGLVISSGAVADMDERRQWCPETTTAFLQRDGGQGFLDLLNTILDTPNGEAPSEELRAEPILVSHPVFDGIWHIGEACPPGENEAVRNVMQNHVSLSRNFYLSFFLWNTILNMYGKSQNYMAVKPTTSFNESLRGARNLGSSAKEAGLSKADGKRVIQEAKNAYAEAERACASCSKLSSQLPEGTNFLRCSKCMGVGRKVMYCNKDCQLKDWKHGNPPHKTICGKPYAVPGEGPNSIPVQQSSGSSDIPPPDPGFIRSPELVNQIALLQDNPHISYVLTQPDPKPDHGVALQHPQGKMMFEILKNRAVRNGDRKAVAMMCNMLEQSAAGVGMSKARLMLQLSKEYGIPVSELAELCEKNEQSTDIEQKTKDIDRLAAQLDASLNLPD
ncbi:hypothetical protein FS837_008279 [Tulasnella sp. UAMH 9824]|nr:hypothetical protein FS837_008279 [Tulasnella sp. UAMH 9824]